MYTQQQASLLMASAVAMQSTAMQTDTVSDEGFWDVDNRPAGWGRDSTIAMEAEYSVRHHPKKCNKCVKLDIPCIVLPDKKYGFTRLACANCDKMKITCTIDGVGVWERLQAKAKSTEAGENSPAKRSKTRAYKLQAAKAPGANIPLKKITKPITYLATTERPMDLVTQHPDPLAQPAVRPVLALVTAVGACVCPGDSPIIHTHLGNTSWGIRSMKPARARANGKAHIAKCFDLLATNKQVDMLDAKLDTVEERLDHRLNALEQWLSTSDEQWKATSLSLGNLYMGLQKHKDDLAVHRPCENIGQVREAVHAWMDEIPHVKSATQHRQVNICCSNIGSIAIIVVLTSFLPILKCTTRDIRIRIGYCYDFDVGGMDHTGSISNDAHMVNCPHKMMSSRLEPLSAMIVVP
ncbi:hypothetical protein EV424DRAFT_1353851 [Suillus variegatus]|nr:hypothetical protein EV424DRAFT_1353851 [Suillus variegatus]